MLSLSKCADWPFVKEIAEYLPVTGIPPREEFSTELTDVVRPTADSTNRVRLNTRSVRGLFIYYAEVTQRVNTAIVSRVQADQVFLFRQFSMTENARPTLGIRIGNTYFFTVHAQSMDDGETGNRNEAPEIVNAIENYMVMYYRIIQLQRG